MASKPVIGLTGGIGSGKSAAADEFAARGARIVDTDVIAHALTGPGGRAMPALREAFGTAMLRPDGALDRDAMRAAVFADPTLRQRLEAILHPRIRAEADAQVAAARADRAVPYVVLVVPLLVESGSYADRVDAVVVVDCSEGTQVARVMARNGLPQQQVELILAAQASRAARLAAADHVLDNDGDLAALRAQVALLDDRFRRKSSE